MRKFPTDNNSPAECNSVTKFEWLSLAITIATSFVLIGWVLWRSRFGIDFTDESYYLVSISNPWLYKVSITQFGYIYHPLYLLVKGDVVLLRQGNFIITLGLALGLCTVLFRTLVAKNESSRSPLGLSLVWIAIALSTSSLVMPFGWLPTPSYNTLALQSLLIAGAGILLAENNSPPCSIKGWVLIGIAGWLAFMAKPTTAAALGIVIVAYLLLAKKLKVRMLVISLITVVVLGLLSAWIIDGSILGFLERLRNGVADSARLAGGQHTISKALRWDSFSLSPKAKLSIALMALLVALATYVCFSVQRLKRLVGSTVVFACSVVCLVIITDFVSPKLVASTLDGMQFLSIPLGAVIAVFLVSRRKLYSLPSRNAWALVVCFVVFPHVSAFGSNNNYWESAQMAAIFWVLAGVTLLTLVCGVKVSWRIFLPVAAMAQMITTLLLYSSMEYPYRQPQPLRRNQNVAQFSNSDVKLLVSRGAADYIRDLERLVKASGFNAGEPMIDLTGHFPGALYAIGARSIGLAWLIGGYAGSDNLAAVALDRVSCGEIGRAWILTEPSGPRKLSPEILKRYALELNQDYIEVGRLNSPNSYEQQLLKPSRTPEEARIGCEKMRASDRRAGVT